MNLDVQRPPVASRSQHRKLYCQHIHKTCRCYVRNHVTSQHAIIGRMFPAIPFINRHYRHYIASFIGCFYYVRLHILKIRLQHHALAQQASTTSRYGIAACA